MSDSTARAEIAQLLRQFAGEIEEWMQRPQRLHHEQWTEDSLLPSLDDEPAGLGDRFRVWCEPKLRVIRSHCLTTGLRDVVLEIKSSLQEAVDYLDALWDYTGIPFSGCYGTWNITPAVASRDYTLGRSTPVDELLNLLHDVAARFPEHSVGQEKVSTEPKFATSAEERPNQFHPDRVIEGPATRIAKAMKSNASKPYEFLMKQQVNGKIFVVRTSDNSKKVHVWFRNDTDFKNVTRELSLESKEPNGG